MRKLELLAPAKNLECGIAAIDHGADAVYIGATRFGARVTAGNSVDDIRQLCDYAHQYSAKVYVTLNTIVYDNELEDMRQLMLQLEKAGADAFLIQDMGLLEIAPQTVALHASTQTDNRTADKVRWLHSLGFSRVVLARELSVDEISDIHEAVPDVELEVFVHGALCVSYSGLCYASQHCFGRSANRGACAQFCRMKFDLLDADGNLLEQQRYLLSLKDLNQIRHLEELAAAGAVSFKIEGRLKDVSYVKNVVAAYSQELDRLVACYPDRYQRASTGHCTYSFTPNLNKTFNRGFTTYFLHGRQQDVGTVKEIRRDSFNVAGIANFANGDGLCFINEKHDLEGFRINRCEGNRLYPYKMPLQLRAGMSLYRNNDQVFERCLARPSAERKIPVEMQFDATADGFSLTANGMTINMACEHQEANKPQHDNICRQLSRLGGTAYECSGVEIPADFKWFVPNSLLSAIRREMVETLNNRRQQRDASPSGLLTSSGTGAPVYDVPYFYNIANHKACEFYGQSEVTAYELKGGVGPLMQCRHCLRYSLGCCVKHGGSKPKWREPLFLRLGDGRMFRLEFDCKNCQMNVYASL